MAVSMRDLDSAFQGAGQKAYPLFDNISSIFELFTYEFLFSWVAHWKFWFLKCSIYFSCIVTLKGLELLHPNVAYTLVAQ
jgi:hypothetical protein